MSHYRLIVKNRMKELISIQNVKVLFATDDRFSQDPSEMLMLFTDWLARLSD